MDTARTTAETPSATPDARTCRSDSDDRIAAALERLHDAVDRKPGFGHATSTAIATLGEGVGCATVERPWEIESDLAPAFGGERAAPSPSTLLRAALANCLAMGYRLRAAERGIELRSVRVTVETESELRGMLRPDADVPPGFTAVRYHVEIDSPAGDDEVEALVDDADLLSPVLDTLRHPRTVERTVSSRHEGADVDAKLQRWIQRNGWDRAAEYYQPNWQQQLRPAHDAVLAAAGLQPGERVVDIACGTGMVGLPAARAVGPHGRVVATDISQRMVDDTARRAHELGLTNVDAERREAEHLGDIATSGPFDVALCSLGLMYVPVPPAAMAEMVGVLRPGGRVVAAVWGERRNCGWAGIFPVVDARVESDVCPLFFALGAPGNLAGLAAGAGLVDVDERRIECDLVYDDAESALAAAFLGGPVALAYSRFDDDTKASAHAEYLASIEPYRDGEGYRVPGEFVIVAARTPAPGSSAADREHLTTSNTNT